MIALCLYLWVTLDAAFRSLAQLFRTSKRISMLTVTPTACSSIGKSVKRTLSSNEHSKRMKEWKSKRNKGDNIVSESVSIPISWICSVQCIRRPKRPTYNERGKHLVRLAAVILAFVHVLADFREIQLDFSMTLAGFSVFTWSF